MKAVRTQWGLLKAGFKDLWCVGKKHKKLTAIFCLYQIWFLQHIARSAWIYFVHINWARFNWGEFIWKVISGF